MKVYEAIVIDKAAGAEPISYESHVVVDDENDGTKATDWELFYRDLERETGFTDDSIHHYFTKDEWQKRKVVSGGDIRPYFNEIEAEEFKYLIGKRVA